MKTGVDESPASAARRLAVCPLAWCGWLHYAKDRDTAKAEEKKHWQDYHEEDKK